MAELHLEQEPDAPYSKKIALNGQTHGGYRHEAGDQQKH
jgi:hypothetical protein